MARIPTKWLPNVVIVGGGFGGLSAAKALKNAPYTVTLIDRHNYHLFQPLLYQVATAALSPADIAAPIRGIVRGQDNCSVVLAKVSGIDTARQRVLTDRGPIHYDHLIVATGARHAYFGHDEWENFAQGIKKIEDATALRRKILLAFELAETEPRAEERRRLLSFVIVGGGPTGVEIAGAVAELARKALAADFRNIDPRDARIVLVEAGERLLPSFDQNSRRMRGSPWRRWRRSAAEQRRHGMRRFRRGARRHPNRQPDHGLGGRRARLGGGKLAERQNRQSRAGDGRTGSESAGPPEHLSASAIRRMSPARTAGPLPGVATVAKQQAQYVAWALMQKRSGSA